MTNLTPKQLESLEAKIRSCVPESKKHSWWPYCGHGNVICEYCALIERSDRDRRTWSRKCTSGRPLRFADMLIAIPDIRDQRDGDFCNIITEISYRFDLHHDYNWNIEHNPELGLFLYPLLCND